MGLTRAQLNEHIENAAEIGVCDSEAVITHADDYVLGFRAHPDLDAALGRSELRRVIQQVGNNLGEPDGSPST